MDVYQHDFLKLIDAFEKNHVQYLIVGGFAINRYGYHRATGDVDFYIKDSIENRRHLMSALEGIGYGRFDELLTAPIIAGYCEIMMDSGMYADLMTEIPGLNKEEFDQKFEMGLKENINGITLRSIHYNHLIRNKIATGRPKDLQDVQELEKINRK